MGVAGVRMTQGPAGQCFSSKFPGFAALENRRKERIGAVPMRKELEVLPCNEVDPLRFKQFFTGNQLEFRLTGAEGGDHRLVLLLEQAAGRVDEPAAGFHEAARRSKDAGLL